MSASSVTYLIPPGKILCYITGKLRRDTPEEHVRQRWARSLVEEYGYSKSDIGIEFQIAMGSARPQVDIAIFRPDASHKQENITLIVETKRDDARISDARKGVGQLKSHMAACLSCRFGLWVGQERQAFEKTESGFVRVPDIPRFGSDGPEPPTHDSLVETHELSSVFRRCHNYLVANSGLHKDQAFHEFLKLIFCKTYDEEESSELRFFVGPREQRTESGQRRVMEERINPLFDRVLIRFSHIFNPEEKIRLEPPVVAYIVSELQYISLIGTRTDVKGEAYEELVGANLRGDRGEYFTPRNVCEMAVHMVMSLYSEDQLTSLKVLDCCCGSGGFLVSWLGVLSQILIRQERRKLIPSLSARERASQRTQTACNQNLFGLDITEHLVRTCQMNLVLHGDGSVNVHRADTTKSPGEWNAQTRDSIAFGGIDVVLTNPPFGSECKIDDPHVLDQYELTNWEIRNSRSSMPSEWLFVEAAWKFLKPGGYLGIVVPDGILNNNNTRFIRSWIFKRCRVIAVVDLPKTTFARSGGVNNPSFVLLQRLSLEEIQLAESGIRESYEIFMSAPRTSGITSRSEPVYLRHPDGRNYRTDHGEKVIDDQISTVAESFQYWCHLW